MSSKDHPLNYGVSSRTLVCLIRYSSGRLVNWYNLIVMIYADDKRLYMECPSRSDYFFKLLVGSCVDEIRTWIKLILLALNDANRNFISYNRHLDEKLFIFCLTEFYWNGDSNIYWYCEKNNYGWIIFPQSPLSGRLLVYARRRRVPVWYSVRLTSTPFYLFFYYPFMIVFITWVEFYTFSVELHSNYVASG